MCGFESDNMATATIDDTVRMPTSFTDVLYLTNRRQIPPEVKRLFKQKKLSYCVLPIDQFCNILHRLDLIGTVIIDAANLDEPHQHKLAGIIESLEICNIGVILLNGQLETPGKGLSVAKVKSFLLPGASWSESVEELWVRISVNLAYRKKGAAITVKPASQAQHFQRTYTNRLEEQLNMVGNLVQNLAEQLRLAGLVQHDFLPDRLPNTDRLQWTAAFLPAEWVSGDIYDVARIDEKHIGFYVADAVGHSMPAALLTIFIKQALVMRQTLGDTYRVFSPSEVIKTLNLRLTGQKLSGYQFATCCYCLLNTETLELSFARAGHPYPVLIRPGQEPQQLELRGSLLGIFEQADYPQRSIQLQSGDKIILYSDGAEPYIGSFSDVNGFQFSPEFCRIKDLPIVQMFDELRIIIRNKTISPSEFDDITAVGLQIL